jgi:type I restriction enzyme S subunit
MPRASWDYIADFKVTVPGVERSVSFEATVAPALDRALTAVDECKSLAALRDALLPELLSGRLRVGDAEKHLEGAV